jgi:hypothetical protein|nr:MAG TPA: hypothetical protein [Caudoviricetes sp.]
MSKKYYKWLEFGNKNKRSAHVEIERGEITIGAGWNYREEDYHTYTLTKDEARNLYESLKDYFEGAK